MRIFQKLLRIKRSETEVSDDDIPRYPPFDHGLPGVSYERIVKHQAELIEKIRVAACFKPELFERYFMRMINTYASYVHLLPVSITYNHRGGGGLFRHGMEVAFWALQAASGAIFAASAPTDIRRQLEPRWRFAVFIAGLLHDVGVSASNLTVIDKSGTQKWNPFTESLSEWCGRNSVERYYLNWHENKPAQVKRFSSTLAPKIIPNEILEYLSYNNTEIIPSMLSCLAGDAESSDILNQLVMNANTHSEEKDFESTLASQNVDSVGVPVHRYIVDAMRRLFKQKWKVNCVGAVGWLTESGLHIVWEMAVEDILNTLDEDNIKGIPKDKDSLSEILISHDLATPYVDKQGNKEPYWPMSVDAPRVGKVQFNVIRLKYGESLLAPNLPLPVSANFGESANESITPIIISDVSANKHDSDLAKEEDSVDDSNAHSRNNYKSKEDEKVSKAVTVSASKNSSVIENRTNQEEIQLVESKQESSSETEKYSTEIMSLLKAISFDMSSKNSSGSNYFLEQGKLWIRFPGNLGSFGYEKSEIISKLKMANVLEPVHGKPLKDLHEKKIGSEEFSCLVLNTKASKTLMTLGKKPKKGNRRRSGSSQEEAESV